MGIGSISVLFFDGIVVFLFDVSSIGKEKGEREMAMAMVMFFFWLPEEDDGEELGQQKKKRIVGGRVWLEMKFSSVKLFGVCNIFRLP